jgi:hypothetical protein
MLPPFIIEQIRKREDDQRRRQDDQPRLELPLPTSAPFTHRPDENEEEEPGGVVIIDV